MGSMYPRIRTEGPRPVRDMNPTFRDHVNRFRLSEIMRILGRPCSVIRFLGSFRAYTYHACSKSPCTCNSILTEFCYFFSEGRPRIRAGSGRFPIEPIPHIMKILGRIRPSSFPSGTACYHCLPTQAYENIIQYS